MVKKFALIILLSACFISCEEIPGGSTEQGAVSGNTFIAKSVTSWEPSNLYLVYHFDNDSTIHIEERLNSVSGDLQSESVGFYHYSHPNLNLKIQSICDDCFNYFTAIVSEDKKSFTYEIWDMPEAKFKTIYFQIK